MSTLRTAGLFGFHDHFQQHMIFNTTLKEEHKDATH